MDKVTDILMFQSCEHIFHTRLKHLEICAVRCAEQAYAVLFIIHNAVLSDVEIKSAIGAVRDCELYSSYGILASLVC